MSVNLPMILQSVYNRTNRCLLDHNSSIIKMRSDAFVIIPVHSASVEQLSISSQSIIKAR